MLICSSLLSRIKYKTILSHHQYGLLFSKNWIWQSEVLWFKARLRPFSILKHCSQELFENKDPELFILSHQKEMRTPPYGHLDAHMAVSPWAWIFQSDYKYLQDKWLNCLANCLTNCFEVIAKPSHCFVWEIEQVRRLLLWLAALAKSKIIENFCNIFAQ